MVSPGIPPWAKIVAGLDPRIVIGEIEYAYRIAKAPILAITGTNGKSTTTVMAYLALKGAGFDPVLCGNIHGSGYPEIPLTEASISAGPEQVLVAEVSSYQLERTSDFRPAVAGITNITPDHLDRYKGSFEAYAAAKHRIFRAQTMDDFAVIPLGNLAITRPSQPKVATFGGPGADAEVTDSAVRVFGELAPSEGWRFREPHNRVNAAMCLLMGVCFAKWKGVPPNLEALSRGLDAFKGLSNRMEFVGEKNGVTLINNSMCTNPDALIQSAKAVSGFKRLLVGGLNKGLSFAPVADYLKGANAAVYLYGQDRFGIGVELGKPWPMFETMEQAFSAAASEAKPGDTVLLAPGCASQDQFQDFRERGTVFKSLATRWIQS